ncbi:MAG TPA: IPT/TIG domain-containing protein [Solirubrobacteraceae bacterium]|nr:IPT/TIG domain-containing protein [Solirubrobacteraceae bacterium]
MTRTRALALGTLACVLMLLAAVLAPAGAVAAAASAAPVEGAAAPVEGTAAAPAAATPAAAAPAGPFRVQRVCGQARPGAARCLAMKLVPAALGEAQLHANALTQSREAASGAQPAVTVKSPYPGYLTPQALHEAYELPSETDASHVQTVAVVDAFDDPTAEADLDVYDKQFGLPPCTTANGCFTKVNESGHASPLPKKQGEWASEISIDVQMVRAICQTCRILLVEASSEDFSDLGESVNTAAELGADEISNSYGGPEEKSYTSLGASYYDHPGIVLAASSGDCGYFNKACPGEGAAANFPADSSKVLAVGGTSLSESKGVWTSTVWDEGGSGCSKIFSAAPWQGEVPNFAATGCGSGRSVADVAAIGDPETGVDVYDSTPEGGGSPTGWGVWGGTSVAAPIVAAEFALAGGARGVGYPASTLYSHLGDAGRLYDVTAGKNGSCGGTSECQAVAGYDGPTGVGSPLGTGAFAIEGAPEVVSLPAISGVAEQGRTLTAVHGGWSPAPTSLSEQWARCNSAGYGCVPIAGATADSYTVTAADTGSMLRLQETAQNAAGESAPASSAPIAAAGPSVPSVTGFSPTSGITGSTFTIEGTGLGSVDEVVLGKLPAQFSVISSTKIEAIVPDGAKPGKVAVSAPGGDFTTKAKYTPTLSVTAFSPKHGPQGKAVTVKGVGFTASSTVAFAGAPAGQVTFLSAKKLKAVVPAGAGSGPIEVTNTAAPAGTVQSAASFQVP